MTLIIITLTLLALIITSMCKYGYRIKVWPNVVMGAYTGRFLSLLGIIKYNLGKRTEIHFGLFTKKHLVIYFERLK